QPRDLFEPPPQRPLSPLASPLLGAMDNGVLQTLVEVAQAEACAAGEVVFREGATGDALYVILRGAVDVIRQGRGGEEPRVLAHLRAGSFFGEMSLITNEPRSATVVATEDCDFLVVARPHVLRLVETDGDVLRTLLRFFRARLVGTLVQTS